MKSSSHCLITGVIVCCATLSGCATTLRTHVTTLSDRPPVAASTYHVQLSDGQVNDLEVARLASVIHARMTHLGFVRVVEADDPDIVVRFALHDEGAVEVRQAAGPGFSSSHSTSTSTSQTSVANIPVPLTRRSTVSRSSSYGVSTGATAPGSLSPSRGFRFELMFADDEGPSHKVTVSARAMDRSLRELAPCLIEAAFDDFPHSDSREVEVIVDPRTCRTG